MDIKTEDMGDASKKRKKKEKFHNNQIIQLSIIILFFCLRSLSTLYVPFLWRWCLCPAYLWFFSALYSKKHIVLPFLYPEHPPEKRHWDIVSHEGIFLRFYAFFSLFFLFFFGSQHKRKLHIKFNLFFRYGKERESWSQQKQPNITSIIIYRNWFLLSTAAAEKKKLCHINLFSYHLGISLSSVSTKNKFSQVKIFRVPAHFVWTGKTKNNHSTFVPDGHVNVEGKKTSLTFPSCWFFFFFALGGIFKTRNFYIVDHVWQLTRWSGCCNHEGKLVWMIRIETLFSKRKIF